jgi:hypothetical protein
MFCIVFGYVSALSRASRHKPFSIGHLSAKLFMVNLTQPEAVTTQSENGDCIVESDGFELPRGTRTMYELTKGFSSRAKGTGLLADADALAELAGVHKDRIYQALDELLEVHADPLSPNANLPGNGAHQVVAQYVECFL